MDYSHFISKARLVREKISSFDVYPFSLPAVLNMDELLFHEKVTFIVGENGSGKSTLIEAIAVAYGFNAEGGSINFNFSTRDSLSDLYKYIKLQKGLRKPHDGYFLRAESFLMWLPILKNLMLHLLHQGE
jgi:predicted ATPase